MDGYLQLTLLAAFVAGLSGGAHCASMCGPLIGLACPPCRRGEERAWLTRSLAYNAGRIASYSTAGVLAASLGAAGLALRGAPVAQHVLLAVMSTSLVLMALYLAGLAPFVQAVERAGAVAWRLIGPGTRRLLPASTPARAFGLGVAFGWLPCGLVYVTLLAAVASAEPLHGALIMAAFGLGTLPNVLAVAAWFGAITRTAKRPLVRRLMAAAVAAIGVLGLVKAAHPGALAAAANWCLS